jgi:hypothetical protein
MRVDNRGRSVSALMSIIALRICLLFCQINEEVVHSSCTMFLTLRAIELGGCASHQSGGGVGFFGLCRR